MVRMSASQADGPGSILLSLSLSLSIFLSHDILPKYIIRPSPLMCMSPPLPQLCRCLNHSAPLVRCRPNILINLPLSCSFSFPSTYRPRTENPGGRTFFFWGGNSIGHQVNTSEITSTCTGLGVHTGQSLVLKSIFALGLRKQGYGEEIIKTF